MLTALWLAICTLAGYFIGPIIGSEIRSIEWIGAGIGLLIGLMIRFMSRHIDDIADVIGDIFD